MSCNTISIILGGGKGERLYPLTKHRAKPAVPIAGKFRLIDIPVSNCLHSEVDRIFVLTQFNSTSLNRHIAQTYRFDTFSRGYVQILAAQQTLESSDWYQGTADAVRQNLRRFIEAPCQHILILAGDHLYRMDYRKMIQEHVERDADITVAVLPVERDQVREFGILRARQDGRITDFIEKPQDDGEVRSLEIDEETFRKCGLQCSKRSHVASMGIYIFKKDVLIECLADNSMVDFGKHIIPLSIATREVYAHFFDGYWRDVGTIRSYYDANLELNHIVPEINFYDDSALVYTHPRFLPGCKINSCIAESSIICDGSIISDCEIRNSIIGIRSIIRPGAKVLNSIIMGADYYDSSHENGLPKTGIGEGSIIQNAIIDQNVRIGRNVMIINRREEKNYDGPDFTIRDGIVVIHKNAALTDGTVI